MIVDALLEADKALHFSDKIHSAKEFVTLDDSLLKAIENFSLYNPGCGLSTTCCTEKSVHVTPRFVDGAGHVQATCQLCVQLHPGCSETCLGWSAQVLRCA